MRHKTLLIFMGLLLITAAKADWVETNKDGVSGGGLDYLDHWVAAWNGNSPNPATNWYTAGYLSTWYGSDPGWTGNVVNITDADATAYAAANKVESFTDVKASVSVSTADLDEEFGVMVRASNFTHGASITNVSCYAATFSANNATTPGDPMKFTFYKIINGSVAYSEVVNPVVPQSFDDFIVYIELTAIGNTITAELFNDADSSVPLDTISIEDNASNKISSGYTGVLNWDYTADGISSYYDTLSSIVIPEPTTFLLFGLGVMMVRRKRGKD